MAENIQKNLVKAGFDDLGVQERPGIIVLRRTKMPAVLVEAGFLDHPEDNRILMNNLIRSPRDCRRDIDHLFPTEERDGREAVLSGSGGSIQGTAAGRVSGKGACSQGISGFSCI